MPEKGFYNRHFSDPQRERAFLSALGFTSAFATARGVTHAIRAGVGPFHNISSGGRHIHHSTFGILGLLGVGFLWAQQIFVGRDLPPRWGSRVTSAFFGVASALTLDEFALWLDLHDDYWDKQGRKSIDAVIVFAGLLSVAVAAQEALDELGVAAPIVRILSALDIHAGKQGSPQESGQASQGHDGSGALDHEGSSSAS
jgi:hypothetical protein